MDFPVNLHIASVEISTHLLLELVAYTAGFQYYVWLRKKTNDPITTSQRTLIFIAAAIGAIVFSRIIGYLETPEFHHGIFSWKVLYGSKTILGGLLGGLLGVEICKKIIGVSVSSGDLITYPLLLAMIIGRIGCFLAGLEDGTYGVATTLPWAINFGDGIYRHPTNLYEIIFLTGTWILLFSLEKRYGFSNGSKFKLFLFSYLVFRFFIEFIKPVYVFSIGLSAIQLASLIGVAYYYKVIVKPFSLIQQQKNA